MNPFNTAYCMCMGVGPSTEAGTLISRPESVDNCSNCIVVHVNSVVVPACSRSCKLETSMDGGEVRAKNNLYLCFVIAKFYL